MTQDRINILIVDDLPEKRLVLETVLQELGQNIVTAQSGQEALRRLMEDHFAVILLDVNMPDMDGYETAALIRKRRKSAHTPIIFVTAFADEVHTAHGYNLGAVDFILSPVVPEILRTKVKVFVDLFRMTQQIQRQAEEQVALVREQAARTAAEETVQRLNFMAEASKTLASSLDLEATLRGLLDLVVPREGDVGILILCNDQGQPSLTEMAWMDPAQGRRFCNRLPPDGLHDVFVETVHQAILQGKPQYLPQLDREANDVHLRWPYARQDQSDRCERSLTSLAILPLLARGRALGALTLAMADASRRHGPADLALLEDLAHRAAIALDNAQLYKDIRSADRRKNEFLSMLAHELRNPLAPLLNGIHVLRLHGPKQLEIQKVQDMMGRQVHHLVRLVDDLLDISRITCNKIQLQMGPVETAAIVDRAVEVSRPLLDSHGHELTVTLPTSPGRVHADAVRLAQVISNLLNNAAKYTQRRGRIWLTVEHASAEVVFRVRDNGMGIPTDMLSCVFDLFTQVERSLDRSQGGLGIGLTLVRRLVEMHGGSVQAFSAGPNLGSEFVVRLPALEDHPPQKAAREVDSPAARNGHRRILVVDDNVDVAESTAMLLRQTGQEVQVSHDGPAALLAAQSFQPQIVLLDIGLPGMDGYEVARQMRWQASPEKTLLVALTGYGQEEDRQRSQEAGFDHHLVKPATLAELTALIANSQEPSSK